MKLLGEPQSVRGEPMSDSETLLDCVSYFTRNTVFIRDNVDGCALAEAACVPIGTSLKLGRN